MVRSSVLLTSAVALQTATTIYAAPSPARPAARDINPPEPPVFDPRPLNFNSTNGTYVPRTIDSAHFRVFLHPQSEGPEAVVEGLKAVEAAYDCFVGLQGWRTTGLAIEDAEGTGPFWKTEFYMTPDVGGGWAGLTHFGSRAWIQLNNGEMTDTSVTVHEWGHALQFHQKNSWPEMTNTYAWGETFANWLADTYLTSDTCRESRAKFGRPQDYDTIFQVYKTLGESQLTIVDASSRTPGNNYQAWPFFHYLTRNPDGWHGLGRDAMLALIRATPPGGNGESPLHFLQNVLGDTATAREVVGWYWARMANVDIDHPKAQERFLDNKQFLHMQNFDKVSDGQYSVKPVRAPRYMGASMAKLLTAADGSAAAGTIALNITASAGAAFIATVAMRDQTTNKVRYVKLEDGAGSVDVAAGEEPTLVVVNAPMQLLKYNPSNMEGSGADIGLQYSFTVSGATVAMY